MKIFVRRIPRDTTKKELIDFVLGPFVKKSWLSFKAVNPDLLACQIIKVTDQDTGVVEYHGILRVSPDDAAEKMIRRLNGQPLKQIKVAVRRYFDRAPSDQRWHEMTPEEFRNIENRRRRNVLVEEVHEIDLSFKGRKEFNRTYGK
jgi:RNA recognition motif-containing protein